MTRNEKYTHEGTEYTVMAIAKMFDGYYRVALSLNGVWAKVITVKLS